MRRYDVIAEICDHMLALGWEPYQNDHEDANGQFEMNWDFDDALATADQHAFFKFMVKSIAEKHGLRATFMPKPFQDLTGNGCHAHVSVWDKAGKTNVFADAQGRARPVGAGLQLPRRHHAACRRRWPRSPIRRSTPTSASMRRARSRARPGRRTRSPGPATTAPTWCACPMPGRFELRLPDGAANPYLLQAAILAAGLDGIAHEARSGQALDIDMYAEGPHGEGRAEAAAQPARRAARVRQGQVRSRRRWARNSRRLPQAQAPGMECLCFPLHRNGNATHARHLGRSSPESETGRTGSCPSRRRRANETQDMKYSIFSLARAALSGHRNWPRTWRDAAPKPRYDVVIIGGGGHGLATAYYLAKRARHHQCRGAGEGLDRLAAMPAATPRSSAPTTCCPATSRFYELSMKLWEGLEQDLNYNAMVSQRGVLNLYHSDAQRDAYRAARQRHAHQRRRCRTARCASRCATMVPVPRISTMRAFRSRAGCCSGAAARRAMTRWPGAMPAPPTSAASTSSRTARSPAYPRRERQGDAASRRRAG